VPIQPVLDLKLDIVDNRCSVTASAGDKSAELEVAMLPDSFKRNIETLQDAILRSVTTRSTQAATREAVATSDAPPAPANPLAALRDAVSAGAQQGMIQEIGTRLFDFAFQRGVKELYSACYEVAAKNRTTVLIKLSTANATLASLPWETLFDGKHRHFVAVSGFTSFLRCVPTAIPKNIRDNQTPLRILGMAARVKTLNGIRLDEIEVDPEQRAMKEALNDLDKADRVKMCWLTSARAKDINRGIARGDAGAPWDIFHFIGHGGYDPDRKMGFIVVQEDGGSKGKPLYSDELKDLLIQPRQMPSLVVLNSCSGAATDPGDLFSSTAADLIAGGIDAVVAMQFEISDRMGVRFSESFYTFLSLGKPLQEAMAATRAELRSDGFAEWISPVLYMSVPGGGMVRDDGRAAAAAAE
jgi:hypothetical protein